LIEKNGIIARNEDGFFLTFASRKDFPKLKKIVDSLSEESKKFYHPWLFRNRPPLKIKLGQFLARMSLTRLGGKLIKNFFPYGYAVILKCMSEKNEIVGIIAIYNFKRLTNGTFKATHGDMIIDEFQSRGLGSFQRDHMREIAKKENVSIIYARVHVNNERSLSIVLKNGWKIIKTVKNAEKINNEKYDMIEIIKEL